MPYRGIALPLPHLLFRNEAVAPPPFESSNAELIAPDHFSGCRDQNLPIQTSFFHFLQLLLVDPAIILLYALIHSDPAGHALVCSACRQRSDPLKLPSIPLLNLASTRPLLPLVNCCFVLFLVPHFHFPRRIVGASPLRFRCVAPIIVSSFGVGGDRARGGREGAVRTAMFQKKCRDYDCVLLVAANRHGATVVVLVVVELGSWFLLCTV